MVPLLSLCRVEELGLGILRCYAILSTDFNDNSFVELAVINDGVLRTQRKGSTGGAAEIHWSYTPGSASI